MQLKISFIISFLFSLVYSDMYNILSLDGGGIRGLITAKVVDYMEQYAYNYSVETYCMDERTS